MASIGHIAVGMAAARVYRRGQRTRWPLSSSMVLWSALSLLPDADVIGFRFRVAYADPWGHRDGGLGCALWWPFDDQRHFAPWNPLPADGAR